MPVLDWIGKDKVVNHHNEVPYQVLESKYTYVRMSSLAAKVHEDFLRSQVGKCTRYLFRRERRRIMRRGWLRTTPLFAFMAQMHKGTI